MVTPTKGGGFSCDSLSKLEGHSFRSHSVAVAEVNGKLLQFVAFLKKAGKVPSVTNLVTCNMPRGRGCKGGATPSRRKRQQAPTTRVSMTVGAVGGQVTTGGSSSVGAVEGQVTAGGSSSVGGQVNTAGFTLSVSSVFQFASAPMVPPYYPGNFYQGL